MELPLTEQDKVELKRLHRQTKEKRHADRIKIITMLDKGFSQIQISELLMLDGDTVSTWSRRFSESRTIGEFLNFQYTSYDGRLSKEQIFVIRHYIKENIIYDSKQIIDFIREKYSISYSVSGIKYFLHRHGFSYKQLIKFNSKSSVSSQEEFVNTFKEMNNTIENTDSILFLDAVHPQHNSSNTKAWIETGKEKYIECNTGRARLNLNGAYDPIDNNVITVEGEKIDSENTIKLFQKIESAYPDKKRIYAFADNAKYYKSKAVKTFLETSRIILIHIPPYCPNLNLIERLWKFMRKKVINTKYFQKFTDFRKAILDFFDNIDSYASELKKFIGLKMHIINPIYPKTNLA
jgi:transposase